MEKRDERAGASEPTSEDAMPERSRREIIRKLAAVAGGAVVVTVLLERRSEAS